MQKSQIIKSTQEQAAASWIDHLNQLRLEELFAKLATQDINKEDALEILTGLQEDINTLITSNRGGSSGIHGFIAERVEVAFGNARNAIVGMDQEYVLLDDNGPVDFLKKGVQIQQKFCQASLGLKAIQDHLEKYPDYKGKYQIPKDYYEQFAKYATMSAEEGGKLVGADRTLYVSIQKIIKEKGLNIDDIEPSLIDYSDVQRDKVDNTIDKEKENIEKQDEQERKNAHQESKPTLQEGLKATAVSSAIEGGMGFCLGVIQKRKEGKKLSEFTADDWKDIGIDTAVGSGKGAVRGASIYGLTNFTATPAAVASALVTAMFGVTVQARLLQQGKISEEDFIINSEVICLDVSLSTISSLMGQVMIPIPVLGAVIGNATGMFMYGIAKNNLSTQEQNLIVNSNSSIQQLNEQLDEQYIELIELLKQEFAKFKSILDLAFDFDINIAFAGSIAMAQYSGCDKEKILWNKQDVDAYFLN